MTVVRAVVLLFLAATLLLANTFKLYLKSGEFQMTREYKVEGDRVRYYSTERGEWEEIPLALCDLDKTESERHKTDQDIQKQTRLEDAEEKLERAQRKEVELIPMNVGAYYVQDGVAKTLEYAESDFVKSKKRQALQKVAPIPIVSGKATVEIKGERANFRVNDTEPEFYLRLERAEQFGMFLLTPKKGARIVEDVVIAPVTNENFENPKQVPTFQREVASGLFKIWPEKPLAPGEYALVEYTAGELDMRIWDFAYQPANSQPPAATPSSK
jgi:hypothetical protein